jgi:DNA-binding SARP family transcriptional activator
MELFWSEAEPEAARRNLHQAIYSLRQTLKQDYPDYQPVLFEHDGYLLNPEVDLWVDYVEFEHQVQAGRWLERAGRPVEAAKEYSLAEVLYRGDFLEADVYEDWTQGQREYLRQTYLDFSDRLSDYYLQQGQYPKVLQLCQKVLKLDNCYEAAHRRLMHCYLAQGQRHLAVRQYHSCVQILRTELETPPLPETRALYDECIRNFSQTPEVSQISAV